MQFQHGLLKRTEGMSNSIAAHRDDDDKALEALVIFQADAREKWFSLFPHYIAEVCEKTDNDERRHQLFQYVLYTSLVSDTVSAVRRLLKGDQRVRFAKFIQDYRASVEAMWSDYPSWVQGRLRGLLASLHVA